MGLEHIEPNRIKPGKKKFDDKHIRVTTYIEVDTYQKIQYLRETGMIDSVTKFYNSAIKDYLQTIEGM